MRASINCSRLKMSLLEAGREISTVHGTTGFWTDLKAAKTRGHQISNLMAGLEYDPDNPVLWSNLAVAS